MIFPKVVHHSEIANDIAVYCLNVDVLLVQIHLNSDLASLSQWANINGLKVNMSKCPPFHL